VKTVVHTLSEAFLGGPCTAFTERFITHTAALFVSLSLCSDSQQD